MEIEINGATGWNRAADLLITLDGQENKILNVLD